MFKIEGRDSNAVLDWMLCGVVYRPNEGPEAPVQRIAPAAFPYSKHQSQAVLVSRFGLIDAG